nr:HAMP domain-containing sensor histidine kinase [Azospirillum brasilense]
MTLSVEELPDGELDIRFSDDGVGIAPDNLPKVFEPFFTTKRGTGGSGLGLHIVFNLVTQSLGGRISVDSPAPNQSAPDTPMGGGTTFLLRIPVTAPRMAGAAGKDLATDEA